MIEVEKKFKPPPSFEEVLAREGAVLVQQKEFSDSYFDFTDFKLTLQDCWLRKRNDSWEMKHRGKDPISKSTTTDSYHELDAECDILKCLADYISMETSVKSVQDFITELRLEVFASFETRRRRYKLDEMFIDLDSASFGYDVGEIEVMVKCKDNIDDAEIRIESLAERLGLDQKSKHYGKIEEYLWLYNPYQFKKLVENKIIRDRSET